MKVTTYNPSTGQILSVISSHSRANIDLNISEGVSWIEGEYSGASYYIKNGTAVAMPDKPDYPCDFDYAAETWVWNEAKSWSDLRFERDNLLSASDWTQVPDAPVDQAAWAVYRQELRELPEHTVDPRNPVWPTPPE